MSISERVAKLKHGKDFTVKTEAERVEALKAFKHLKEAKFLSFELRTKACKGGFKITRI